MPVSNSNKVLFMKRGSSLVLKGVISLIGAAVLAICIFGLPTLIMSELTGDFDYGPIFVGLYIPAIPFFFALYQAFKLLGYIDQNKVFTEISVKALQKIKYCAFAISAMFAVGMPYIFYIAERDDAPGLAALGFIIVGASFVITTAAAVFQSVLQNAVDLQSENNLTV